MASPSVQPHQYNSHYHNEGSHDNLVTDPHEPIASAYTASSPSSSSSPATNTRDIYPSSASASSSAAAAAAATSSLTNTAAAQYQQYQYSNSPRSPVKQRTTSASGVVPRGPSYPSGDSPSSSGYNTPTSIPHYPQVGQRSASVGNGRRPSDNYAARPPVPYPQQPAYHQRASSGSVNDPQQRPTEELGRAFDQMSFGAGFAGAGGQAPGARSAGPSPAFGPQHIYRSKSPGAMSARSTSTSTTTPSSQWNADRANNMYAHQEMYQSAAEVREENSLAAIGDAIDATASNLASNSGEPPHSSAEYQQGGQASAGYGSPSAASGQEWQYSSEPSGNPMQQGHPGYSDPHGNGAYFAPGDPNGTAGTQFFDYNSAYGGYNANYYPAGPAGPAQTDSAGNPYFAAAQGFGLDFPGMPSVVHPTLSRNSSGGSQGAPHGGFAMTPMSGVGQGPGAAGAMGMVPPPSLYRQGTTVSVGSSNSLPMNNVRRRSKDVGAPQQTLPFNKEFVSEYRARMKADPDPEEQFRFARYLIEAAKKIQDPKDGPKQARKYRDQLLSDSLKLIKKLATTGMGNGKPPYAEAQFFLANCFGNGSLGLQVDHEKAYNLYVQASKQNHPAATYRTAVCNEVGAGTRRDHHRAVLFYRKASALGDTAGMYKLGMVLLNGLLGQQRNVREAIVWLKRAAGQADEDNPHALHELALLHEKPNQLVPHDEAYSRELYTQAAQLGYAPSQFKLGSAYEYGALTCPVDPRRSIAWYTKAAGKNDGESELALSGWYLTGSEGVLKQSDSEAYLWARRAATKGIPKAEYAVGYYSEVGIGVKADLEEAKRWYMRAAAQGNKRAMQRLTELKKAGTGSKLPLGKGGAGGKGARPTRGDAEKECVVM